MINERNGHIRREVCARLPFLQRSIALIHGISGACGRQPWRARIDLRAVLAGWVVADDVMADASVLTSPTHL